MDSQTVTSTPVEVRAENVGGIDETAVSFSAGTTVLAGRNATNRTSFLQAIMAGLGSDTASLKGDADEGRVELSIGDETYERTLTRSGGSVVFGGDPYLDDVELAELFAFLLESNEARRAVARGDDLRDLIMRPVDTDEIQVEIRRLETEKREIDDRLESLDDLANKLPDLEERRTDLAEQIEDKRAELEAAEEAVEDADVAVSESREGQAELEESLDELKAARSSLETVRFQLETERDSLDALEEERERLEAELEELPGSAEDAIAEIKSEMSTLRDRRSEIDSRVDEIHTIVQFNQDMLEGTSGDVARALRDDDGDRSPAEALSGDASSVVCWTCGSSVEQAQIEETIDRLRDLRKQKVTEREEVSNRLDELSEKRSSIGDREAERNRIDRRLDQIGDERERRQSSVEDLEERRESLRSEIENLEAAIDDLESDINEEVLDRHREANELEFELGRLEDELDAVEEEIGDVESSLAEREDLDEQREEINEALEQQRTRIERIERESVEAFNEHMADVLDLLEYANLERIWIERTEQRVTQGRGTTREPTFDLHVVRTAESGTTYEDTIEHLSESEREVTGLVFALAGYLVHEVYESVPFILLDSLEAIDSERIAALVDYLSEYAEYLVVALLPEDASTLENGAEFISDI